MIKTLDMACRNGDISDDTRLFYPFNENQSPLTDVISNIIYDPSVVGNTQAGEVSFSKPNAVTIDNGFDGTSSVRTPMEHNLTLNTRKVWLMAAILNQTDAVSGTEGTRVNIGVGDGQAGRSVFSLSLVGSFHSTILEKGALIHTGTLGGTERRLVTDETPNIIYMLWDGLGSSPTVSGTVTAKALNMDGSIFNDGAGDFSHIDSSVIFTNETFTPENYSRLTNADYYSMIFKEMEYVPKNLDYKLAQWGLNSINGHKSSPRL